jgi:alpha-L-rhamnosidase
MLLSIVFLDGTKEKVVTDTTWTFNPGPVTAADIYDGETYNAALEEPGWDTAAFVAEGNGARTVVGEGATATVATPSGSTAGNNSTWTKAAELSPPSPHVQLTSHAVLPAIQIGQSYPPCSFWESSPGVFVYDFCQNMAGFATLFIAEGVATEAGVAVNMLHAEAIRGPPENKSAIHQHYGCKAGLPGTPAGTYPGCMELVTYVTDGSGAAVTYTPRFTYAGFRYIQLQGYPGTPGSDALVAHFVHTGLVASPAFCFVLFLFVLLFADALVATSSTAGRCPPHLHNICCAFVCRSSVRTNSCSRLL